MEPVVFAVNDNDALPLEYKLQERRPVRYLDLNDIINNPAPFCVVRSYERRFEEQAGDILGADLCYAAQ